MPDAQLVLNESGRAIAPSESHGSILEVITRAATDDRVDVAKMTALLDLQERIMAKQAEIEFNRDFAAASAEMPRVAKHGKKDMGGKGCIPFAKYEDIDSALRPIEKKYGFTRTFLYDQTDKPGVLITLKLTHRAGHSERSTRHMAPDKGPGRNDAQAEGSSSSYLMRYMTLAVWNIVTVGADDDGNAVGFIDEREVNIIIDMLAAICEKAPQTLPKVQAEFLTAMKAKAVSEIHKRNYPDALEKLRGRLKKVRGE